MSEYFPQDDSTYPAQVKKITVVDDVNPENANAAPEALTKRTDYLNAQLILLANSLANIDAYSKAETDQLITNLIDGAPDALNTLNELAAALNDNDSEIAALLTAINGRLTQVQADDRYLQLSSYQNKNLLINGNPNINQRGVAGTVTLVAGEYGHDRWRAGVNGCVYTFSTIENITTITISSGSLEQEIEGRNVYSGDYTLSWQGTAQCMINDGFFGDSPITKPLVGGENTTVEINTGTFTLVQLEKGSIATRFEFRTAQQEEKLCEYFCFKPDFTSVNGCRLVNSTSSGASTVAQLTLTGLQMPRMRVTPVMLGIPPSAITLHHESGGTSTTLTSMPTFLNRYNTTMTCLYNSADITNITQMRFSHIPYLDAEL